MAAYTEDDQGNKSSGRLVVVAVVGAVLAVWIMASMCHRELVPGLPAVWCPKLADLPDSVLWLVGLAITGKLGGTLAGEKITAIIDAVKSVRQG